MCACQNIKILKSQPHGPADWLSDLLSGARLSYHPSPPARDRPCILTHTDCPYFYAMLGQWAATLPGYDSYLTDSVYWRSKQRQDRDIDDEEQLLHCERQPVSPVTQLCMFLGPFSSAPVEFRDIGGKRETDLSKKKRTVSTIKYWECTSTAPAHNGVFRPSSALSSS